MDNQNNQNNQNQAFLMTALIALGRVAWEIARGVMIDKGREAASDAADKVMGKKRCPSCGTTAAGKYCPNCGASLGD